MSLVMASTQARVSNADYRNILAPELSLTFPSGSFRPLAIHISTETVNDITISSESQHSINIEMETR